MKRNLLLVLAVVLILIGLFLLTQVFQTLNPSGQGALQVTSNITGTVFLDDKNIGETPVCKCDQNNMVKQGEYMVKIVPSDTQYAPFVVKVKIEPGVLTAVERTFLPGSLASAYVLTLEKTNTKDAQLFIGTLPDSAVVTVDSVPIGASPHLMESISASEHEVEIQKDGFAKKTIRVRTVENYKLIISAYLGTENGETTPNLERVSPTPTLSISPSPNNSEPNTTNQIQIDDTPVGFLRVRSTPSTAGTQLGTVDPGEIFSYTETQNGWYKITLTNGTQGWVSGTYVTEVTR
ncbi:MAG TPA: SH3 domain-containing protein [Candidatus Levybacteria bacterium]|nr:SH3 domain-containing protein [Candidatus Levybacteria bacterium]